MTEEKVPIGISACLLGQAVRYNGGHKRDPYLVDTLGFFVRWVPVCPEAELGMGTPREPVDLVLRGGRTHMMGVESGEDWTVRMEVFARRRIARLPPLSGYVFKADSPSCGPDRVKLHSPRGGTPSRKGVGLFAAALKASNPLLPIVDEGRLHAPALRDNFLERVFAHQRLRGLLAGRPSSRRLMEFHAAHKFQLLAHSPSALRKLGQLAAAAGAQDPEALRLEYAAGFMRALEQVATPDRNANALQHMLGFLKKQLSSSEKQAALDAIEAYRKGLTPLLVPLTLIRHFVRTHGEPYLAAQTSLNPDPQELMVRNHA